MKKLVGVITLIIGLGIIFFVLLDNGIIWFVYPDSLKYPVHGIDVSHHQGIIDWEKVGKENIDFAYIKATEGDDLQDEKFQENWKISQKNIPFRGAYLFYSLRINGDKQAENFIRTVPVEKTSLPPAIDLEFGGNSKKRPSREELKSELLKCATLLEKHYGKKPILYITNEFYKTYIKDENEYKSYNLWVRDLFKEPDSSQWPQWIFWQYKNRGRIKGIEGFVDLNVYKLSLKELEK